MAIKIDGKTITLTRGDTFRVRVPLYSVILDEHGEEQSRTPYVPQNGDTIRFAVKHPAMKSGKQYKDETPLIIKNIPTDSLVLTLNPEDTKDLDFDTYVYDMEITYGVDGSVYTFITAEEGRFILTSEVH